MVPASPQRPRIAASIRLILAIFRLRAGVIEDFGKAIVDILKKQFPDQAVDANPAQVGHKLMNIARKEVQYNDDRAMDVIQEFLTYITTGSRYETDDEGKVQKDPKTGDPIPRKTRKPWDFAKDHDSWQEALNDIYTNVRRRSMTKSIETQRTKKRTKGIEEAFGVRGEEGGAPEGGEERMPTPEGTELGQALDDKAAIKKFYELMEENVPILRDSLPLEQRVLFDLVFEDNVGTFSSDIESNMGQATALKEKLEKGSPEEKAIYEKNAKRWSGFVGDTRKKLLDAIGTFIEREMTPEEIDILWDEFFSDTTPGAVRKLEKKKEEEKAGYQRGIDERKVSRWKWQEQQGTLSDKDKKSFEALKKKLKADGVDVDAIPASETPEGSAKKKKAGLNEVPARVAAMPYRPAWM